MRFRLRTLMIVVTAVCVFCAWQVHIAKMATYHRRLASDPFGPMISLSPVPPAAFFNHEAEFNLWPYHAKRANDFDHAFLRPWLAFVDCKPDSVFGAPLPKEQQPIIERLKWFRKNYPSVLDGMYEGVPARYRGKPSPEYLDDLQRFKFVKGHGSSSYKTLPPPPSRTTIESQPLENAAK
jgi:hypothetical protein